MYLCYKVGLAKANTLVYEAGEYPLCLSNPLTLCVPLPWCLLAGTFSVHRTHFPFAAWPVSGIPCFLPLESD